MDATLHVKHASISLIAVFCFDMYFYVCYRSFCYAFWLLAIEEAEKVVSIHCMLLPM